MTQETTSESTVSFDSNGLATSDGSVRLYYYDPITFVYTGTQVVPQHKGFSIPNGSTLIAPPSEYPPHSYPQFINGGWGWIEDYRQTVVFNTQTKQSRVIMDFGPIQANETTEAPSSSSDIWNNDTKKWEADSAVAQREKDSAIKQAWQELNNDMITCAVLGKTPGPKAVAYAQELYKLVQQVSRPSFLPPLPDDLLS